MYHEERWTNGWLWIQSTPNGRWHPATTAEVIMALHERVVALEARVNEEVASK